MYLYPSMIFQGVKFLKPPNHSYRTMGQRLVSSTPTRDLIVGFLPYAYLLVTNGGSSVDDALVKSQERTVRAGVVPDTALSK